MYFQLLCGTHVKNGKKFEVITERNKETGEVLVLSQPIIESEKDMVAVFGANKFRRVYRQEMNDLLLKAGGKAESTSSVPPATDTKVDEAVKQGAVGIAELPGVDVTDKFPEISEYDEEGSLKVYFKRPKGYYITDDGNIVTDVPLKKDELLNWVKIYKGK